MFSRKLNSFVSYCFGLTLLTLLIFAALRSIDEMREQLQNVMTKQNRMQEENQREHERLLREGQNAIAKLSADSQFLDHVREIVRLIKSA